MRVELKWVGAEKMLGDLETFRKTAVPYAMKAYVNDAAFAARKTWQEMTRSSMKLRSSWTERSIQVDKAKNLKDPTSVVGSVADYMADQESGAVIRKTGKHGEPIPAAAPGARKFRNRTPARNQLRAITLVNVPKVGGIRQKRNAVAISKASAAGGGVVFLDLRKNKGLYRITGTKRDIRIRKIWDLSKSSVRIPSNPMLERTIERLEPMLPAMAEEAVLKQLRRHRICGY